MSHHEIGFMGGFSAPGRLTPLTFGTGSTHPTGLTFHTIGIPERDVSLRTLRSFILTAFEIGEDKLGNKFFFLRYVSQVTQMISHDVFLAGRTMVFSATMVFFLSLGYIDDFVTCQAFSTTFRIAIILYFWYYVSGNTFGTGTSFDIFGTSPVLPFWDNPSFYTRCRSLRIRVSLCCCSVAGRTNKSIWPKKNPVTLEIVW